MYDFDESGVLTLDEMVLAFRSSLSGLSKLSRIEPPTETDIESIVVLGFDALRKNANATDTAVDFKGIDREAFVFFCLNTPEIMSWIEYFDDLEEYVEENASKKTISVKNQVSHIDRGVQDEANMNPTIGGLQLLEYERKGGEELQRQNWRNVLPFLAPARKPEPLQGPPSKTVDLEWVYGFNAHSARQCLYYSAKGAIVYPAGSICIVENVLDHKQTYFNLHTDLILCLKLYQEDDGKTIVATGECGVRPAVHVWDCESQVLLSTLQGFHRNGVSQLDFSPDRTKLVTLGMDPYHSIAVYAWKTAERIWASITSIDKVHDVRFLSNDIASTCGEHHIIFWKENKVKKVYKRYKGKFGAAVKSEVLWCVGQVGTTVFSGSETGMLYVWEGRNLVKSIKGHTGTLYACHVVQQGEETGLVTACSMGKVLVWNSKLELGASFNAASLGAVQPCITSICCDFLTSKILIGFRSCEVYEMDSTDGRNKHNDGSVVAAHFNPRLCGLAPHPTQEGLFCTVGDDKSVRIFDAVARKQVRVSLLDSMGHCCAYAIDGQTIIVGLGSGKVGAEERKEGAFVALSEEDLTLIYEARDSKQVISDCKFSPDGEKFVLSSHDGSLYVYSSKKYVSRARCRGHSGKVEHVDFAASGQYLMSNCDGGDLLFWDTVTGELQTPKSVKAVMWETNSCAYSYMSQGLWDWTCDKGVKYTALCKSHAQDVLISGTNYGEIKICKFPCLGDNPGFTLCYGHAKGVTNIQVSCDDGRFYSTGESDGCILQWKVTEIEPQKLEDLKRDESLPEVIPVEFKFEGKSLVKHERFENIVNNRPIAICEMEEGCADAAPMLPWQKSIVGPSRLPIEDNSEPPDALELEFMYGFTTDISRQAVLYSPNGELIFFSAAVAVQMSPKLRTQRFYNEHTATITAMAVNKINGLIATGEQSEAPKIRIWSSETLSTACVLDGFHRRAINHLKFSPDGRLLLSVGHDANHSIALYDWKNKQIICCGPSFTNKSLFADFNPSGTGLIHCGNEIVRFWQFRGRNMTSQDGNLGNRAKLQGFMCAGWIGSSAVVGTADGNLYRFLGIKLDSIVQAHTGPVNCISSTADGLATCSNDGFVKIWTRFLECRMVIEMKDIRAVSNNVKTIDWDYDAGKILIGTASSEIYEVSAGDGESIHPGPILEGHGGDELWGLAVNPVKEEFCTVGDDSFLRVWNPVTHSTVATVALEMPARCCAFSPDGKRLAVGFGCPKKLSNRQFDGKWVVLDTDDFQVTHEAKDSSKWITDIKYSPNGELIVMGSYDYKIYVYAVNDGYALNAVIGQHQSFITAVDISDDSQWIQSNCGGLELFYFEADTGLFIPAASRLRDTVWSTQNCTMSWPTQGIWPPQSEGTECTACDCNLFRGDDGTVIASGDNYGRIRLFRYPCSSAFAISKLYWTSANPITRIRFVSGDSSLVTLSGVDKSIAQWAHKREREENVAHDVLERQGKLEEDEDDVVGLFGLTGINPAEPEVDDASHLISSRPWIASMVAPSDSKEVSIPRPLDQMVVMDHILGVGTSTRASVRFNNCEDISYPTSKYVCVYNKKSNRQLFYKGHASEISCVAVSIDGLVSASAEKCNRPCIHLWDSNTCASLCILPNIHRRGIVSMQFSPDRKLLASVGQDQDHSIALWMSPTGSWGDGRLLAWSKGDVNPVLFCSFYNCDVSAADGGYLLGTGGRFHQKFWRLNGKCLNASYAEYDKKVKIGTLLCGAVVGSKFLSGSTSGHLYVWQGKKLDRLIRAHELGVTAVWSCSVGAVTAAKDGTIKMWSLQLDHIRSFTLTEADVPPVLACVRSLDGVVTSSGEAVSKVLATTAGGEIYEIAAKSGSICLVQEAHFAGQLWGLCVHPSDADLFATCGDDKTIRVWSVSGRRLLRKAVIDCTARSIAWSPDGAHLIVGMGGSMDGKRQRKDGAFLILDALTMKPIFEGR